MSASGVSELVAMIETMLENSIRRDSSALEHNLLGALALNGKQINLVSTFNSMLSTGNIGQTATTGTVGQDETNLVEGKMIAVTSANCIYNKPVMQ